VFTIKFGIVKRPYLGMSVSGDSYLVKEFDDKVLIAVVDGLGHGLEAAEAANKAVQCIRENYDLGLTEIIRMCHETLRSTRGAALGIVLINQKSLTLSYAGIGEVGMRVVNARNEKPAKPVSMDGVVGQNIRKIKEDVFTYVPGDVIILHSDGISDKFNLYLEPFMMMEEPQKIAESIADRFGKSTDDALIIVAK
jgi:negative regulator of sigma-B (phosphoserine phosphatase)